MRIVFNGPQAIDIPSAGITGWKPDEVREVPDALAEELLGRGEFAHEHPKAKKRSMDLIQTQTDRRKS